MIAFTSSLLLLWWRPSEIPDWSAWTVVALNAAILTSTVLVQGPAHNTLARDGYDDALVSKIIATNLAANRGLDGKRAVDALDDGDGNQRLIT